jgi:hypothetical protein
MTYRRVPREVRIKLTRMRIILFLIVVAFIAIIYLSYPHLQKWYQSTKPMTEINYFGVPMRFREDVRLAKNIEVYPNETYIKSIFRSREINGITIGILNFTNETNIIGVEAVEITFKLSSFYSLASLPVAIKGKEIGSLYEISGNSTNPVIIIIPPTIANETLVRAENYTVFISGKTLKDLDLATIKFISVVLGI